MPRRFGYSRWDGTQVGFELDAEQVLAELTDDVLYHGDLNAALRRLLQNGMPERDIAGIRELLDEVRRRRREDLDRYHLGGPYHELAQALRDVVDTERASLDALPEGKAAEHRLELDLLPPDLARRIRVLQGYDFTSEEARRRFEALLDDLRRELVRSQFNRMAGAMSDLDPAQLQRVKDMVDDLNRLLEMRQAGEDTGPAFDEFMRRHGHLFPENPRTLDELLERMAAQMAAAQAMYNSVTPEQRSQLQALSEQLLGDMDLQWQLDRLGHNMRQAVPGAGWDRGYDFAGNDPLGLTQGAGVLDRLGELDDLENLLGSAANPGALADVDVERAGQLLGEDAARSLQSLAELSRLLAEAGLVENREGRLELTPKGLRRIGRNALCDLFARLSKDRLGRHAVDASGAGHERSDETKPYEFGDPFNLNIERTVRNALAARGGGTPVLLSPDDFEVDRTETLTRTSTVLMLDLSLSMPMRDNFLAAKKVAMALHSLISTQYPRDYLGIVGFSELARELKPRELPEVSWDFVYGTNMHHGLTLSRRMLTRQPGTRQIVMITDGEPTAHVRGDGEVFFHYPPVRQTVDATLGEVARCTREGIRINTFMLDATTYLKAFVDDLTRLNRGRAFFTTPETLGDYVLVDFIEQKRSRRSAS
ncbi:MAG TPA: hypothetical protein VK988_12660 [Acidimicrobiales bacterium]|nr:hypothetical protein [Acidimicrobiales bacterium]